MYLKYNTHMHMYILLPISDIVTMDTKTEKISPFLDLHTAVSCLPAILSS